MLLKHKPHVCCQKAKKDLNAKEFQTKKTCFFNPLSIFAAQFQLMMFGMQTRIGKRRWIIDRYSEQLKKIKIPDSIFVSIRVNLDEFWSNAKSRKPTNYEDPNNDGSTDHKRKRRNRERNSRERDKVIESYLTQTEKWTIHTSLA